MGLCSSKRREHVYLSVQGHTEASTSAKEDDTREAADLPIRQIFEDMCDLFLNTECVLGGEQMCTMTEFAGRLQHFAEKTFVERITFDIRDSWIHPHAPMCAFYPKPEWWRSRSITFVSPVPHATNFYPSLMNTTLLELAFVPLGALFKYCPEYVYGACCRSGEKRNHQRQGEHGGRRNSI